MSDKTLAEEMQEFQDAVTHLKRAIRQALFYRDDGEPTAVLRLLRWLNLGLTGGKP